MEFNNFGNGLFMQTVTILASPTLEPDSCRVWPIEANKKECFISNVFRVDS